MKALITGVAGQDGSFLAELLLKKGYEVHGFLGKFETTHNIDAILSQIHLWEADLIDSPSMLEAISKIRPDEIYHFASQSDVGFSFTAPILTSEVTALGTLRLLEVVKQSGLKPRIYNAASSEMFGGGEGLTEESPMIPRSPYGVAKLFSYGICGVYRSSYGMFITNGILFNHESERRGSAFVTRKIAKGIAEIAKGNADDILLGNLDARRDWGYAPEYVEGIWRMMQLDEPQDLVLATGESHSVKEFAEECFKFVGLEPKYHSVPELLRPWDVSALSGDSSKANKVIGWNPKIRFKELVEIMMRHELI